LHAEISAHAGTRERLGAAEGQLREREAEIGGLRAELRRHGDERARLEELVRAEFSERLTRGEAEVERLAAAVTAAKTEMRAQLAAAQDAKDQELDALHARVRTVISKRDEAITSLRAQLDEATARGARLHEVRFTNLSCNLNCACSVTHLFLPQLMDTVK
jgi:DNA repair exonuclease SbcCD ATPase subunit